MNNTRPRRPRRPTARGPRCCSGRCTPITTNITTTMNSITTINVISSTNLITINVIIATTSFIASSVATITSRRCQPTGRPRRPPAPGRQANTVVHYSIAYGQSYRHAECITLYVYIAVYITVKLVQ